MMNEQAKAMGMKATSYKNPEGLTEAGHTTTARDLSILATRLMRDFPQYVALLRDQEIPLRRAHPPPMTATAICCCSEIRRWMA